MRVNFRFFNIDDQKTPLQLKDYIRASKVNEKPTTIQASEGHVLVIAGPWSAEL